MSEVTFDLPWPPSVNHVWRSVVIGRRPRVLLSKDGRRYREDVALCVIAQRGRRLDGPLEVEITLYPPNRLRCDTDNRIKPVLDALQRAGVFEDDYAVVRLVVERKQPVQGGRCLVRVSECAAG